MPFASVRIEDGKNKNSTQIRPCCLFRSDKETSFDSLEEYFESDMLRELQQHLLTQDTLPPGCSVCKGVEEAGQQSVRQLKNKFFTINDPSKTSIQELDIFPSNVCNLSCIMCNPKFSSAVGAEQKKLGKILEVVNFDDTDRMCDTIQSLPNLKYINIAGGEFFYAKHCLRILKLIQSKKIEHLRIITNATIVKDEYLEILKTVPDLTLRISIDGTHNRYEFIRYPAKWDETKENILKFQKELPDANIEVVMVMQPLSIYSVFDWLEFTNTHALKTFWSNILGTEVNWDILTVAERTAVSEFIMQGIKDKNVTPQQKLSLINYSKNTIQHLSFDPLARAKAVEKIVMLCKYRKISFDVLQSVIKNFPDLEQEIIKYETSYNSHSR